MSDEKNVRRFRMNHIMNCVKACQKDERMMNREMFISNYCVSWNVSRRTVLEYLKMLVDTRRIVIREGLISTRDDKGSLLKVVTTLAKAMKD